MFCSNCGKQLEDGARFCKYCGASTSHLDTPVPEPTDKSSIMRKNHIAQEKPVADSTTVKTKARRGIILSVVLIAAIALVAGVFLARSMRGSGDDSAISKSDSAASKSYALPELPDALTFYKYDENGNHSRYFVEGQTLVTIPDNRQDAQLAEDGTMAMRHRDGGSVQVYRNGEQIGEIPEPVGYFYLSGSGKKIVYGTTEENSYLWDVSNGESTLVSDTYRSKGISYDGNMLDMGQYYSRNGGKPIWMYFSYIRDMSPDGKYVYYGESYKNTSSDGTEQNFSVFCVMIDGEKHELLSYSDPDYYPFIIACSQDYREVLFAFKDDIYYFSIEEAAKTGFEAQHVGNVDEGILLSLNVVTTSNSLFAGDGDVILEWRSDWYTGTARGGYQYRNQKSIQNGVFCLLKEQDGIKSASLVRLVNNQLVELIPNITGNICLSADETKLWCVADGRLTFCDLNSESPHAVYCDASYVRAYGENGEVAVSGERIDEWAMRTVPIAITSDGETACFISVDGSLWMCTPDTIHNPQFITDGAFWVQCSADDMFYLMKGDSYEYIQGIACDLYQISATGEMNYQYNDVFDMYMTKANVYISVGKGDGSYPTDVSCALYCASDGGYRLICDDYFVDDISLCWWGKYF